MVLLYVPRQDGSRDAKCPMVEQIYSDGERIYVLEGDMSLTMPYYDAMPDFDYHSFQVIIISRNELPEAVIEKYLIE